jgi:hypothetical protein
MREGVPQGSVLAPLLFVFYIDDLQDCLPKGVHSSLFADDSALWVHTPQLEDAFSVLQESVREVHRWSWAKKLTLNLKKYKVSFSADPHGAKWRPVVEVKGTVLRFNQTPFFLVVGSAGHSQGRSRLTERQPTCPRGVRC